MELASLPKAGQNCAILGVHADEIFTNVCMELYRFYKEGIHKLVEKYVRIPLVYSLSRSMYVVLVAHDSVYITGTATILYIYVFLRHAIVATYRRNCSHTYMYMRWVSLYTLMEG